jgi:hypothetical protein
LVYSITQSAEAECRASRSCNFTDENTDGVISGRFCVLTFSVLRCLV